MTGGGGSVRRAVFASVLTATVLIAVRDAAHAQATAGALPAQYVAKLSTEGLGRAPDQVGWQADLAVFAGAGCTTATLEQVGKRRLESAAVLGAWAGDPAALAEIGFRAVLNREPDPDGFRALTTEIGAHGWDTALSHLYRGSEFATLVPQICSSTSSSYGFNGSTGGARGVPACTSCLTPKTVLGAIAPTESELRALASVPGAVIVLAPRTLVTLTQPLLVARGVTIETAGLPGPTRYLDMARLVRGFGDQAGAENAAVVLDGGAALHSIWVSGERALWRNTVRVGTNPDGAARWNRWGQIHGGSDVKALGGLGTSVVDSRVDDAPGTSSIELLGQYDGYLCLNNLVEGNLVEAYSSVHIADPANDDEVPWTDGVTDHCQSSRVTMNQVVDATDVPIILFQASGPAAIRPAQASEVSSNVIVSAGNSAYSALAADPSWNTTGPGDPPGGPGTSDFTGAVLGGPTLPPPDGPTAPGQGNLLWTGPRTHFSAVISDGTTDFYGSHAYDGHGAQVLNNTTGSAAANAAAGIVVSGMMDTVVEGNRLAVTPVPTGPQLIWRCSGAEHPLEWFFPQRASGAVQGSPVAVEIPPPGSPGCIVAGT